MYNSSMRKIIKNCSICHSPFGATCGVAKFCSDDCQFLANVEKTDACWLWKGALDKDGYGSAKLRGRRAEKAHRLSYRLRHGDTPRDMHVCHSCDNPRCVNPDHLFLGDAKANKADCVSKGRHIKGTDLYWKAKLTPEQVRAIRADQRPSRAVAHEYGVSDVNVQLIRKRAIWKHIA